MNDGTTSAALGEKKVYLDNLQILRAFAALNVVVYHAVISAADYQIGPTGLEWLGEWGRSGVDFFFVLSGYLMFRLHGGANISAKLFTLRRIVRIVPIYWLLTCFYVALVALMPMLFREADFDLSYALWSLLFVSQWIEGSQPYIGPGWTLEYEMIFYGIFALTLTVPRLSGFRLALAIMSSIIMLVLFTKIGSIAYCFCIGIGAAVLRERCAWVIQKRVLVIILMVGLVLYIGTIGHDRILVRWIQYGVPAALIVLALGSMPQLHFSLGVVLGDASYSIYLVQMFTIPFVGKIWGLLSLDTGLSVIFVPIVIVITTLAGIVLRLAFELPAQRIARRFVDNTTVRRSPSTTGSF